ncbi:MAG: DNA helicase UvrD [Gordonia sp.]|uniref:DEAD/DEAH box helicase n=1 Tax=Gordonia sp. (in: high G+C Gram-positive bacteria) TaxID=84139 RepID=UPI000C5F2CE3|nr:DEAD/DEAH box helicase [Gordonia sp. (in: high G+C Gram-positive bacteria)]MAU84683.1 DNA helicase UvrD [Gordonia sp. (in: high G+C Gram-positive bacteria)]
MNTQVLMHQQFEDSYDRLDGSIRNRVLNFMVRLQREPESPGLDLKHPQGAPNYVRTARVTDNYRAVLVTSGTAGDTEMLSLVAVRKHDDAYEFANSLRLEVNAKTGAAELYQPVQLQTAMDNAALAGTSDDKPYLPRTVRQLDLERFGVAAEVAERLTTVADEDDFLAIAGALPATQGNAVLDLAFGKSPDDVWRDYGIDDTGPIDVKDVKSAFERPISRLNFTAAAAGNEDELRAVLEGDFAKWRVWLHPLQRKLAYHDGWNGPYRVTGGAGTGKTVTAIHRARHLAERLEKDESASKVLLTTFTRNLVKAIEAQLVELAGAAILKKVDVQNVDSVARAIVAATDTGRGLVHGSSLVQDTDRRVLDLWRGAAQVSTGDWDAEFLADEWSLVVLGNAIQDEKGYLRVPRSGRSQRLSRPQRADVWLAIEQFQRLMRAEGLITFTELASRAAAALESDPKLHATFNYRHAVIDEAQDLHPAHWKMLRSLIDPATDDLFIVGDAHQRIYGRPTPLSRYGIETRGRSRRLTINYRTSREILRWTLKIADPDVDDLDTESDTLDGARSVFGGPEPETLAFDSAVDENQGIVDLIKRWNDDGMSVRDIAVFAYEKRQVEEIAQALTEGGVDNAVVGGDTREEKLGDVVRVMTMHRAKGLEFRGVILARTGDKDFPPRYVTRLKGEARERETKKLRSVLYVAGSRARERMAVTCAGKQSSLLAAGRPV